MQIRHLHPPLANRQLRLIHSGRLLTDGVLLLPWLRSLEERVRRQAKGMGGDVEEVLREVGVGLDGVADPAHGRRHGDSASRGGGGGKHDGAVGQEGEGGEAKVFLHCTVGGVVGEKKVEQGEEEDVSWPSVPGSPLLFL